MAKQRAKISNDIFKPTEAGAPPVEVPAEGKITSVSVGLKETEIKILESIVDEYNVSKNALLRLAARRFLEDVLNGRFDLEAVIEAPKQPRRRIKLP